MSVENSGDVHGPFLGDEAFLGRFARNFVAQDAGKGGTNIFSARDTIYTVNSRLRTKRISDVTIKEAASSFFIKPSSYDDLQGLLWRHGLIILEAPRGKGKHLLGVRLLSDCQERLRQDGRHLNGLHYIKMGWQEINAWHLPKEPGSCYLLDLSGSTDEPPTLEFGEDLARDADNARYDGVYLVVLATSDVWSECKAATHTLTRSFSPPPAREIVRRHLQSKFQVANYEEWLSVGDIQELISRIESPSEAAELAEEIAKNGHRENLTEAAAEVLDKFGSWRKHLSKWFKEHEDVPARAAMLAAAVLDPSLPAEIIDARKKLLEILKDREAEVAPLAGPGRTGYLELLQAQQVKNRFSISHQRKGLDEAVIRFVWNEWPQAHPYLQEWLLALATDVPQPRVRRIADVTVKAALQAGSTAYMGLVRKIVTDYPQSWSLALEILDLTVVDPGVGAQVRQRLLGWVTNKDPDFAALAVEACGRRLGQERPSLALHRICRALSRDPDDKGFLAAEKALVSLGNDEISRRAVLDTVRTWLNSQPKTGLPAFIALTTRSSSFVLSALASETDDESIAFFKNGWTVAAASTMSRQVLAAALGAFIDTCEEGRVEPGIIAEIVGPLLAESVNKSLAMMVLRRANSERKDADGPLRSHLMQELIWGQLNKAREAAPSGRESGV
ncbi:hypothetical protein HCA58_12160 [Micromonospora sp. HNM0581]|uniref:hypothetical protein n=1 Tax=Micromonospora sp. HNM0581 TaxID=2716341 RepID=UPI00146A5759|nr:hypothetical protein [Micromonospora sp. HNM0581]NLU79116.1 hypothetical protein [Micromonospora sp. HNM0581]